MEHNEQVIAHDSVVIESIDIPRPRKRGRPPKSERAAEGSRTEKTKAKSKTDDSNQIDRELLARQIIAAHALLAAYTQRAYMAITDDEGSRLANAFADIIEYYQIRVAKGVVLWVNLATVLVMVEAPRTAMFLQERRAESSKEEGLKPGASLGGIPIV